LAILFQILTILATGGGITYTIYYHKPHFLIHWGGLGRVASKCFNLWR